MNKEKILIACSGGPDSMALLDMYKDKYIVYVCHINYHKRDSALRDEKIVRNYCKKYNIPFFKFDYKEKDKGNFQSLARKFRYDAFNKVCLKNDINKVYVAHQMDDHIETYLMQKKRNTDVSYYGISKKIIIDGMEIHRPLLNKTKQELLDYDIKNDVPFGIDESNLTSAYARNKLRNEKLSKLSKKEKLDILKQIKNDNDELLSEITYTKQYIKRNKNSFEIKEFINFKYFKHLIRELCYKDISLKQINEIKKALTSKNNVDLKIRSKHICKEYNHIYIYNDVKPYSFKINSLRDNCCNSYFRLSSKGSSKEGVSVCKSDFPLSIRSFKNGDTILMKYGSKKVNRFFIDNKVSSVDRKTWPIVLNAKGEIILVPGIGCNLSHYSNKFNLYVLKLSYYEVNI